MSVATVEDLRGLAEAGAAELGPEASAEQLLGWTARTFGDRFIVASNMQDAVLVDLCVAVGPVIASIHEKRDEFRERIMQEGALDHKPKLRTGAAELAEEVPG